MLGDHGIGPAGPREQRRGRLVGITGEVGAQVRLEIGEVVGCGFLVELGHLQPVAQILRAAQRVDEVRRAADQQPPDIVGIEGLALERRPADLAAPEAVDHRRVLPVAIDDLLADIARAELDAFHGDETRLVERNAVDHDVLRLAHRPGIGDLFDQRDVVEVDPVGQLLVAAQ